MSKPYEKIDQYRDEMLRELDAVVRIPSVSSDMPQVKRALHHILDLAKRLGFHAETVLDERVGIIEMGQGDETLGILVHIDVVPPGDRDQWQSDPFAVDIRDGILYGRGVIDDKGPIIETLYAMRTLVDRAPEMKKRVRVIIGTQEEVSWDEIEEYARTFPTPDYGYTPDGKFPMNNIEKGYTDVEISIPLGEGGGYKLLTFEAGTSVNSIPDRARATLQGDLEPLQQALQGYPLQEGEHITLRAENGVVTMEVQSVSAHASLPEKGINAISTACKFLRHAGATCNLVEFICEASADDYYGKSFGLYREEEYFNGEYIHRTVISPTTAWMGEDGNAHLNFNARQTLGVTKEDLLAGFEKFQERYGYSYTLGSFYDTLYVPKDRPFLQPMAQAYDELSGYQNGFRLAHGTSYAKAMKNIIAWGPKLPDDEDTAHMVNERLPVETFFRSAKVYSRTMERILFEEKPLK